MPTTIARPITDFYDNLENARTTKALINRIAKSPSMEAEEKQAERASILQDRSAVVMASAAKAMGVLVRQIEMIQASKKMSPAEKTQLIRMNTLAMIRIADRANEVYQRDAARRIQQRQ